MIVSSVTVAVIGALLLIFGLVLHIGLLWTLGIIALVVALGLYLYEHLAGRRRSRL